VYDENQLAFPWRDVSVPMAGIYTPGVCRCLQWGREHYNEIRRLRFILLPDLRDYLA
jgi:hypothetical protein